jgi:hypothetical protein
VNDDAVDSVAYRLLPDEGRPTMSGMWPDATQAGITVALRAGEALTAAGFPDAAEGTSGNDPTFSISADRAAVTVRAGWVGFLGSRAEVLSRFAQALRDSGFSPQQLDDCIILTVDSQPAQDASGTAPRVAPGRRNPAQPPPTSPAQLDFPAGQPPGIVGQPLPGSASRPRPAAPDTPRTSRAKPAR